MRLGLELVVAGLPPLNKQTRLLNKMNKIRIRIIHYFDALLYIKETVREKMKGGIG